MQYGAFIFDMNGTMIDDMHFHEKAWYDILVNELGAPLTPAQAKAQMYGKNEELFERVFGNRFSPEEIDTIVDRKEKRYQDAFLPHLKLIDGLDVFLQNAQAKHIALAIGTAAPKTNVDYVMDNLHLWQTFPVIIGADDVKSSKPDPEVFLKAATKVNIEPHKCIVFEDSPKGIEAARNAGMKAVGVSTFHTAEELSNDNVLFVIEDYTDERLKVLFE